MCFIVHEQIWAKGDPEKFPLIWVLYVPFGFYIFVVDRFKS